jgi:tRNA(Ile)-lysidine synthase
MRLESIEAILKHECQLDYSRPVLVGVSGGPDSICLLDVLNSLGYPLIIAHLNHGLRTEAEYDAGYVRKIATRFKIQYIQHVVSVYMFADNNDLSIEEAARILRYQFLFEQAHQFGAQAVAVGHNADDQVETVLMHLLRGAGISGLKGMQYRLSPNPWSQEIPLVRPLLAVTRNAILEYCQIHELEPIMDRSNLDTTIFRNRLRHELIPYLEEYNPRIRQIILRTSKTLVGDFDVINQVVDVAWEGCLLLQGTGYLAFDVQKIKELPIGVQRNILRRAIAVHRPGLKDIDFASTERALQFLENPHQNRQIDLIAGLFIYIEGDRLWIASWKADLPLIGWPNISEKKQLSLTVPGSIELRDGWNIHADVVPFSTDVQKGAFSNLDPYQIWLSGDNLSFPLIVRSRRPGDCFQPLGMDGHTLKVSDFMINIKLPRRARNTWPLVCSQNEILWIPGYRLSHNYRLTRDTQQIIYLCLNRSSRR